MDGLTIRDGRTLIERGQTTSETRADEFRVSPNASPDKGEASFSHALNSAIGGVNSLQKESDVAMQALATGKTTNIPEVLMAVEKADIALRLMTQVRNKVLEAYQEVMRMQV